MKTSAERLGWALAACGRSQIRMTPVRSAMLTFLAEQRVPANLVHISQARDVKHRCDPTTVYRTLMMFKDANLVRVVGSVGKTGHYVLNVPGDTSHFLTCERCGAVVELQLPGAAREAIKRLALEHGFTGTAQHLEVLGLCKACAATSINRLTTSKLMARYCAV